MPKTTPFFTTHLCTRAPAQITYLPSRLFPFLQLLAILLILWGASPHATNAHPQEVCLTYDHRDGTGQIAANYSKRDFDRLTYIYDNEANNNISNRLLDVNENTGGFT